MKPDAVKGSAAASTPSPGQSEAGTGSGSVWWPPPSLAPPALNLGVCAAEMLPGCDTGGRALGNQRRRPCRLTRISHTISVRRKEEPTQTGGNRENRGIEPRPLFSPLPPVQNALKHHPRARDG